MIKILRQPHKKFRGSCRRCGCEFEYELGDLVRTTGLGFGDIGAEVIHCPNDACLTPVLHRGQEG